jgi:hypothetical protein
VASWQDIRAAALVLPGARESEMLGEPAFKVEISALDAAELAGLVREAWTQIVPKKISRAYSR